MTPDKIMDKTIRHQTGSPLHDNDYFSTVFHSSPMGQCITSLHDGIILDMNESFGQIIGYSRSEAIGKTTVDVGLWDSMEERTAFINTLLDKGEVSQSTKKIWTKNGDYRHGLSHMKIITVNDQQLILGTIQDITEEIDANKALESSRSLLQATLESTADGILVVDSNGKWSSFNQKFIEMWSLPVHIVETGDDQAALALVLDQLVDPQQFIKKVQHLYTHDDLSSKDSFELKDGRIFERYSQPQRISADIVGRVWSFRDVTRQRRTEIDLRESEEQFRIISESASDVIWVLDVESRRLNYISPSIIHLRGYTQEEAMQQDLSDSLTPESFARVEAELPTRLQYFLDHPTEEIFHFHEIQQRCKDGSVIWVEVSSRFRFGKQGRVELLGISRDISQRKQAEMELHKLSLATEASPVSILITDAEGNIEYANPKFVEVTGYSFSEILGHNPRLLKSDAHPDDYYRALWETISQGETWRGEFRNKKKSGELYWERASISPIFNEGGVITHFVAVKEDITFEKELEQLQADVNRIMRHDLKAPLNALIGLPQALVLQGNLTEDQLNIVKAIEESGNKMLNMIDLSLDLFKMETDEYEYYPRPVNAVTQVMQFTDQILARLTARNVTIRITVNGNDVGPDGVFTIPSEERLFFTLISNLMINAVEASPNDEQVHVEMIEAEEKIIAIHNKGVVPQTIRGCFFEKYKTHGKSKGVGLGTYSAKLVADNMDYTISMNTSDETQSTTVTINIP